VQKLSIIIPTLNESTHLGATLTAIGCDDEIIVVDGGSRDSTRTIAEEHGAAFCLAGTPGRASQMNHGAEVASGDILLFLHADTIVPELAIKTIKDTLDSNQHLAGGGFYRFFDSRSIFLRATCHLANLRSKYWGIFLGDQGIFVRKQIFQRMGGFSTDFPAGEDLDFSIRMKKSGKIIAIKAPVLTSSRRFENLGPVRQTGKDLCVAARILLFGAKNP
jgi:rSAM/selenodomain-associated transferase 2